MRASLLNVPTAGDRSEVGEAPARLRSALYQPLGGQQRRAGRARLARDLSHPTRTAGRATRASLVTT